MLRKLFISVTDWLRGSLASKSEKAIGSSFMAKFCLALTKNIITKDKLRLIIKPEYIDAVKMEIFNVLGQRVMQVNSVSSQATILEVSHLPNGVYYLETNLPGDRTLKFLKTF